MAGETYQAAHAGAVASNASVQLTLPLAASMGTASRLLWASDHWNAGTSMKYSTAPAQTQHRMRSPGQFVLFPYLNRSRSQSI